jgi:hypothetical protein
LSYYPTCKKIGLPETFALPLAVLFLWMCDVLFLGRKKSTKLPFSKSNDKTLITSKLLQAATIH